MQYAVAYRKQIITNGGLAIRINSNDVFLQLFNAGHNRFSNAPSNMEVIYKIVKMNQEEADEIANRWQYSGIYSFYDSTADEDDYLEFIDPDKRGDKYFSCYLENVLIGFYSVEILDGNIAELGLGLKPEYTGKGLGVGFINAVLNHISSQHRINDFTLAVAAFNERAIRAYEAVGFVKSNAFMQNTNGGCHEFIRMNKPHSR